MGCHGLCTALQMASMVPLAGGSYLLTHDSTGCINLGHLLKDSPLQGKLVLTNWCTDREARLA